MSSALASVRKAFNTITGRTTQPVDASAMGLQQAHWPPTVSETDRTFQRPPRDHALPRRKDEYTSYGKRTFLWQTVCPAEGLPSTDRSMQLPSSLTSLISPGQTVCFVVEENEQDKSKSIVIPIHPALCSDHRTDDTGCDRGGVLQTWEGDVLHAEFDTAKGTDDSETTHGGMAYRVPLDGIPLHSYGILQPDSKARVRGVTTSTVSSNYNRDAATVHPLHAPADNGPAALGPGERCVPVNAQFHLDKPWQKIDRARERADEEVMGKWGIFQ